MSDDLKAKQLENVRKADETIALVHRKAQQNGHKLAYDFERNEWRIIGNFQPYNLAGIWRALGGKDD